MSIWPKNDLGNYAKRLTIYSIHFWKYREYIFGEKETMRETYANYCSHLDVPELKLNN